jgi:F420H(2)-dependent quinone reductase
VSRQPLIAENPSGLLRIGSGAGVPAAGGGQRLSPLTARRPQPFAGAVILLLDHTGAKSGRRRTSPLTYHADGGVVAVVASKGGQPTNPAWFHNLKANPDTTIQIGSVIRDVRARVATDEERDRLWPKFCEFYPGYDFFQHNAQGRKIPIVVLDPR